MKKPIRPTVYESAIDWWIPLLLLFPPVLSAALGIYLLIDGKADDAMIMFLVGAGTTIFTSAMTMPCRYTILDDTISIRAGVFVWQIPLTDITSVQPSDSWISGPALSVRRVAIKTDKKTVLVSPRDRQAFIDDLRATVKSVASRESK